MSAQNDFRGTFAADSCWYVVHCKPSKEAYAAIALRDGLGLATYLPQVKRPSSKGTEPMVLFPGYVFVQADLREVKLSSINSSPGVLRLLHLGGEPQAVPGPVVEAIREQVDALNMDGGFIEHRFRPGDQVWLREGPLRGLRAIFIGPMTAKARVKVLLEFLGRQNEVQVDANALEPARDAPPLRRGRTTRGRGRRIKY